eukprot:3217222-Rhodomonas_salina.1
MKPKVRAAVEIGRKPEDFSPNPKRECSRAEKPASGAAHSHVAVGCNMAEWERAVGCFEGVCASRRPPSCAEEDNSQWWAAPLKSSSSCSEEGGIGLDWRAEELSLPLPPSFPTIFEHTALLSHTCEREFAPPLVDAWLPDMDDDAVLRIITNESIF